MAVVNLSAYFRLMRFHKPVGIALLWLPTAWALWVSNQGMPKRSLVFYFLLGTIVMRAAGCIVNDIADRHIDKHVTRTRTRPLTTGEVSLVQALLLLVGLLFIALFILMQLSSACFVYAIFSVVITLCYPFCKRFLQAPQLILGLAFSMGIPMAYVASNVKPDLTMWVLFLINFLWIVAYDTTYAMIDRADDVRIGVKSTAILFGHYDCMVIHLFNSISHGLWLFIGYTQHYGVWFYLVWLGAISVLIYQHQLIRKRDARNCLKAFSTNTLYGLLMWVAVMLSV